MKSAEITSHRATKGHEPESLVTVQAIVDVLSHWCYAALPAIERLSREPRTSLEILLAPVDDGMPLGFTRPQEEWYYSRGTLAYKMRLRADWCESETTSTLAPNALIEAASHLGITKLSLLRQTMEAAFLDGALVAREDVALALVARLSGLDQALLAGEMRSSRTGSALGDANDRLAELHAGERPTFHMSNVIGDSVTLRGIWSESAILAVAAALRADALAYEQAGRSPVW